MDNTILVLQIIAISIQILQPFFQAIFSLLASELRATNCCRKSHVLDYLRNKFSEDDSNNTNNTNNNINSKSITVEKINGNLSKKQVADKLKILQYDMSILVAELNKN